MPAPESPNSSSSGDFTIPSRTAQRPASPASPAPLSRKPGDKEPPAWLIAAMNGERDLDHEWAARYAGMPLLTLFHAPRQAAHAALTTQDGAAGLIVSLEDGRQPAFTYQWGGMLGLRFAPARLSEADRARWLELMRQPTPEPIFLWGQNRWESDFLIAVARRHYVGLYAYSPLGHEAAARLTADVSARLTDWLNQHWK